MTNSSVRRRTVLRTMALAAAVAGSTTPAWNSTAFAAAPQTYALTIKHLGRDGRPTGTYETTVTGISGPGADQEVRPYDASGTATVRLPKGRYLLSSALTASDCAGGTDWIVQPRLDLDRDTTVTVDARTAAPVDVRPPDRSAGFMHSAMVVEVRHQGAERLVNLISASANLRVAHLGPDAEAGSVKQWFDSYWATRSVDYALGYIFTGARALTGLTRHPSAKDLATVKIRAAALPGTAGTGSVDLQPSAGLTVGVSRTVATPGTATYLVTPERGTWAITYMAPRVPGGSANRYSADGVAVRAGSTTTQVFDNAVFGPALAGRPGVVRDGDGLTVDVPLLADGGGHVPSSPSYASASTTLHRDGVLVGTRTVAPGRAAFTVAPGRATYRMTSTVKRTGAPGTATRVTASWTFVSDTTTGPAPVPVSVVRFSPVLGPTGTAVAGAVLRVPVTVQGAAAKGRVRGLAVSVSMDGGASWRRVPVERGAVLIHNPGAGTGVSLRAELTDTVGNTLTQTIVDAYRTQ
ncbi:serine protease [Streptomyces sp. NBC_00893]|uniref:serine protease n=1 Tax=Streptomyces sp. NBC_00893 TaxID=2975862 RepID=UPI00225421CD|nr:serine protease [Streptomyces sp. NBC_00893]MCX4850866.1 serine protease [Streptomyces sp. NBC_00893]